MGHPGLLHGPVHHGRRPGRVGRLEALADSIAGFAGERPARVHRRLLWGSGVLSGIVDNIPYVASMSPVVAEHRRRRTASRRCCGGRWRSARTWAATPPPSAPAPTSWSSASPPATAPDRVLAVHPLRRCVVAGGHPGRVDALPLAALLPARGLIAWPVLGGSRTSSRCAAVSRPRTCPVLHHDQQRAAQPGHHRGALQDGGVTVDSGELDPVPADGSRSPTRSPARPCSTAALRRPRPRPAPAPGHPARSPVRRTAAPARPATPQPDGRRRRRRRFPAADARRSAERLSAPDRLDRRSAGPARDPGPSQRLP